MTRLSLAAAALAAIASLSSTAIVTASSSDFCPTIYAELHRRQLAEGFTPDGSPFGLVEEGPEKHVPFLTLSAGTGQLVAKVVVGNGDEEGGVWHPMSASDNSKEVHFITHIVVKDQDGNIVAAESLDPTVAAPATIEFDVPEGVTELTPYEWCNLHGLWMGPTVTVDSSLGGTAPAHCHASDFESGAWPSVHADFLRLQNSTFESESPFSEADGVKHTPYITIPELGVASVLVGKEEGPLHPMVASTDGVPGEDGPHWITEVYVVDQDGEIVAMKSLDVGEDVDRAEVTFDIPDGTETLQAYAWCNIHGLWGGPVVSATEVTSMASESSGESSGYLPSVLATVVAGVVGGAALLVDL
jgi:desulfoferrodoxin (superoxide reductase-like protein)